MSQAIARLQATTAALSWAEMEKTLNNVVKALKQLGPLKSSNELSHDPSRNRLWRTYETDMPPEVFYKALKPMGFKTTKGGVLKSQGESHVFVNCEPHKGKFELYIQVGVRGEPAEASSATVNLATLLASFPMYRSTLTSLLVGNSVVLKVGPVKHQVTRTGQDTYTMFEKK